MRTAPSPPAQLFSKQQAAWQPFPEEKYSQASRATQRHSTTNRLQLPGASMLAPYSHRDFLCEVFFLSLVLSKDLKSSETYSTSFKLLEPLSGFALRSNANSACTRGWSLL